MTTWLHEERLSAVQTAVRDCAAARVVDLGCGDGDLFVRLAVEPGLRDLTGLDICAASIARLQARLDAIGALGPRVEIRLASMTEPAPDLSGIDCAVLVETIEHIDPAHLSRLERAVFGVMRPGTVVITTPNAEFNALLGVPRNRMRHPGHRFEWGRARFRRWAGRIAAERGYAVRFADIAGCHPDLGGASQMAVFSRGGA